MFDRLSDDVLRNPYPLYEQIRAGTPVVHDPRADLWMVFDYDGVKRVLMDHDAFSSRAAPPGGQPLDWLIFFDPPQHTKLRALVTRAFTPRVVAGLETRIAQIVRELLDRVVVRGEMDVAADLAVPLPLTVIAEMIGIPPEDRAQFRRWSDAVLRLSDTIAQPGEEAQRAVAAFRAATEEMRSYLVDLIAARRRVPREDLLTRLVHAEVDGEGLTNEEVLRFFQLLLVAGSETTTNLIGNAVVCFLELADALARLRADPALLPSAIEEILRYRSPVQAMFRQTRRDVRLHDVEIPAGKLVLAMIGAANRDPAVFREPGRFDLTRDPNPHLAFGHGIHFCIGAPLARLEGRVALAALLDRVTALALGDDAPWEPRRAFHVHGPTRLRVRFEPRAV